MMLLERINRCRGVEQNFNKTKYFFFKERWDSVIVYSSKAISHNTSKEILNFTYYMRGYSFMKKKLFKETQKEYSAVTIDFPLYNLIIRNLGGIALEQRKYKLAIHYFEKLNTLPKKNDSYLKKSSVIHDLGLCYFHLKEFEKAENYLLKGAALQKKENDTLLLISSYMDIANLYYEQYKDSQAIPYFEKAYALSQKIKKFEIKQNAALNMAVVEENRKDLTKAMLYRKEYDTWKDSVNNQNKIWAVAETEKNML
ncbi:tetratricopeptide repeat protein [Flavobacterium sp.]|uniref:tetratricopeptide repeat protein n=1 Tax=Flavobacterium sp. TaxID=239 RepID=UPI0022CA3BF3|nr:tetratricopeptide repeat protein [Flavobacterium sp.]MCZ8228007.1 tetratricopeptide repeat protein [Flavobacterium sp.]